MSMRICSTCKIGKALSEFGKESRYKDGISRRCKKCRNELAKNYHWKNRDQRLIYMKKYKAANKSQLSLANKNYRSKNKSKLSEYEKIRYWSNPEFYKNCKKLWDKDNRDKIREYTKLNRPRIRIQKAEAQRRRRTKKKEAGVFVVSPKDMRRLKSEPCVECGKMRYMQIDHIIPISRGGTHAIGNLQPMCKKCNQSKHDKFMVEWRMRKGG